jgi:excisionase family DNA binding protein
MDTLPSRKKSKIWLSLSAAADIVGVHFTTLRRWADAGEIECIRTPGGQRRFKAEVIGQFLEQRQKAAVSNLPSVISTHLIDHTRQDLHSSNPASISWMAQLSPEQIAQFRQTGNRLTALLMQYSNQGVNGEAYLEEGKRIAVDYGSICYQVGLPIDQAIRAFQFFQRSILDAVHETGFIKGLGDIESYQHYQRTAFFFDETLLALVSQYFQLSNITTLPH